MNIFFSVTDFNVGGITSSLRNMTNELIRRGHSVSILNLPKAHGLPEGFSEKIQLIELRGIARFWNLCGRDVRESPVFLKLPLILLGVLKKILNHAGVWNKFIFKNMPLFANFDIAVGFRQGPTDYYIVKNKTKNAVKVGFWHGDPDFMGDLSGWDNCVYGMDIIACVSRAVCESMERHYPELKGKLRTVYNIFDPDDLLNRSGEFLPGYNKEKFNIVTVSRIDFEQKGFYMLPRICEKLINKGVDFKWTVVGNGKGIDKLKQSVAEKKIIDYVDFVENNSNPYPYMKEADLFAFLSKSESYGMVVMESLILGTPVVAGRYPALKEVLLDGECGIIADNSVEGIFEAIYHLITDLKEYQRIKKNCTKFLYSSDRGYNQFISLTEEGESHA